MPLDPIVSLSVALAEAPGNCAVVLGSGVSREAGVPTGMEVYWRAVADLYKLEATSAEVPDSEGLAEWLKNAGWDDRGYSGILDLLVPDLGPRRDYLAQLFEGREPARSHHKLAAMAAASRVKVFVTTNFDRLLENALKAHGIEPIVVRATPISSVHLHGKTPDATLPSRTAITSS